MPGGGTGSHLSRIIKVAKKVALGFSESCSWVRLFSEVVTAFGRFPEVAQIIGFRVGYAFKVG